MTSERIQDERRGLRRLLPHAPALEDEDRTRQARLAYMAAWVLCVIPLLYGLVRLLAPGEAGLFGGTQTSGVLVARSVALPLGMAGLSIFSMVLIHRGSVRFASALLIGASWLALVLMSVSLGGVRDISYAGLMVVIVLSGLLLGGSASAVVVVASLIVGWALADAERAGMLVIEADTPVEVLVGYVALFSIAAGLVTAANGGYTRLLKRVSQNDRDMRAQNWELRQMRESLEKRVTERTEDLNRRSGYLEAAARVAYAAGEILDVAELLSGSVDLIRDAFELYYVGLFLVEADPLRWAGSQSGSGQMGEDGSEAWATLRAGTGEAGRRMLARNHRIRVGEGMVGWSIAQGQSRFAQHAEEDRVRLVAPELPETRAEAALPLRSRGRVVGALTVQSVQADFFDEDTVTVLQTMADLIAVALNNAELFEESERAMQALRRAYGDISAGAWEELLRQHRDWGYRYAGGMVQPLERTERDPDLAQLLVELSATNASSVGQAEAEPGRRQGTLVRKAGTEVVIPMRVGDAVIGAVRYQRREDETAWEEDDMLLLSTLTEQLVQALDSARLLQETQRQAAREQHVSEISAKLANTVDVEAMLRVAVQELGQLPGVLEASVHLVAADGGGVARGRALDGGGASDGGDRGTGDGERLSGARAPVRRGR